MGTGGIWAAATGANGARAARRKGRGRPRCCCTEACRRAGLLPTSLHRPSQLGVSAGCCARSHAAKVCGPWHWARGTSPRGAYLGAHRRLLHDVAPPTACAFQGRWALGLSPTLLPSSCRGEEEHGALRYSARDRSARMRSTRDASASAWALLRVFGHEQARRTRTPQSPSAGRDARRHATAPRSARVKRFRLPRAPPARWILLGAGGWSPHFAVRPPQAPPTQALTALAQQGAACGGRGPRRLRRRLGRAGRRGRGMAMLPTDRGRL